MIEAKVKMKDLKRTVNVSVDGTFPQVVMDTVYIVLGVYQGFSNLTTANEFKRTIKALLQDDDVWETAISQSREVKPDGQLN